MAYQYMKGQNITPVMKKEEQQPFIDERGTKRDQDDEQDEEKSVKEPRKKQKSVSTATASTEPMMEKEDEDMPEIG